MPRVKIGPALPDREKLDVEIARLRDLDVGQLRSRWHTAFGRPAPAHLARHLLFRSLAYRLQADRLGDLNGESQRLLDRSGSPEKAGRNAVDLSRQTTELRPGTILGREYREPIRDPLGPPPAMRHGIVWRLEGPSAGQRRKLIGKPNKRASYDLQDGRDYVRVARSLLLSGVGSSFRSGASVPIGRPGFFDRSSEQHVE
jgi:hypothetical protein